MPKPKSRGNGQGTAYRRGAGWQARVVIGWKLIGDPPHSTPIYKTKDGFKTKREALEYCAVLRMSQERPAAAPTLQHYWEAYSGGEMELLSDSKRAAYKIAWNKLKPLYSKRIDSLSVTDLRGSVTGKTYYTARDIKIVLGHLFDLAGAEGWVNKDLPDYIVLPKLNEKERQPFSEAEQAALWKLYEAGDKNAAIPLIMIYTGMMPGELRRLTAEMIDYDKRQIIGVGLKTKVRKESAVYLPSIIIPVLQDIASTGRLFDYTEKVFTNRYYAVLKAAGCRRLTPYSCRHTTATALAVTENIAPQTIKKIMRWSSARMLDRYAHPNDADAVEAIERLKK